MDSIHKLSEHVCYGIQISGSQTIENYQDIE